MLRRQANKIHSLIRRLDKTGPMTHEEIDRYTRELWRLLEDIMPAQIYQYRAGEEGHIEALTQEKVYISDPVRFNDPTDGLWYVDFDDVLMETVRERDLPAALKEELPDEQDPKVPDVDLMRAIAWGNNALKLTSKLRQQARIACFSETIDSDLMWSHYAGEQKGYAIRYNTNDLSFSDCASCCNPFCYSQGFPLYPVLYRDRKSDITEYALFRAKCEAMGLDTETELPIPLLPLIQKRQVWSYEREWRIVCPRRDLEYFDMKPDAIYLGPLIQQNLAMRLYEIARDKDIPMFKMEINYRSPSFELLQDDWSEYSLEDIRGYFEHRRRSEEDDNGMW